MRFPSSYQSLCENQHKKSTRAHNGSILYLKVIVMLRQNDYDDGMELLISAGLLLVVAAWMTKTCHRLRSLHANVQQAWDAWMLDTRRRNAALEDVAELLALLLPTGDMLPRTLRRLSADSEYILRTGLCKGDNHQQEIRLCQEAEAAIRRADESAHLHSHETLAALCSKLTEALARQEESALNLQGVSELYNRALDEPPIRLLAPSFGFQPVPRCPPASRHRGTEKPPDGTRQGTAPD